MNLSEEKKAKDFAAAVDSVAEKQRENSVEKVLESIIDQIPAEVLSALPGIPEKAGELFAALVELPAALDTLSRCTLAKNFISHDADGFSFDAQAFEKAWTYLTTDAGEAEMQE